MKKDRCAVVYAHAKKIVFTVFGSEKHQYSHVTSHKTTGVLECNTLVQYSCCVLSILLVKIITCVIAIVENGVNMNRSLDCDFTPQTTNNSSEKRYRACQNQNRNLNTFKIK